MKTGPSPPRVWLNPVAVWELLDQLNISQNQLTRLAGISPGHLSLLMNSKRSPAPGVRRRLMEALGVDDFHPNVQQRKPLPQSSGTSDLPRTEHHRPGPKRERDPRGSRLVRAEGGSQVREPLPPKPWQQALTHFHN